MPSSESDLVLSQKHGNDSTLGVFGSLVNLKDISDYKTKQVSMFLLHSNQVYPPYALNID